MSKTAYPARLPWQDRWNEPTLEQLLDPIKAKEAHSKALGNIMAIIEDYEGIQRRIVWLGEGWQWCIEYVLEGTHDTGAQNPDAMAYVIPDPEQPILCIPLHDSQIEQIPLRRVNRFIRDQIRSAKCSVEIHWCKWSPSAQTEVEHLQDLVKRKWKLLTGKKR
ncbi:MAG: hypothetical protein ACPGYV_13200 [Phycisphaeraceae bacterium]